MDRRSFLTGSAATAATIAADPRRVFAMPMPDRRTTRLLDVARAQVDRVGGALWHRDLVGIADFGLHSSMPRFHFVNLEAGTAESILVSHGSGSDPEHDGWLNAYSNRHDSWASSRGAYITWNWYEGRFGTSVRLGGLDATNSQAYPRAIVMHAANYSTPEHVARWGRLGRSNGCFAFGPETFRQALSRLRGGRLLFADTLGIGADGETIARPFQPDVDFDAAIAERRASGNLESTDPDFLAAQQAAGVGDDIAPTSTVSDAPRE
ncbi:murein L,D-transpeptidase catalytic domain-containing protein [Aurantiacibacter gangjinensis]|uniref:murein L,D-transpeptidase catalytic domain-containing protein n=1 Tax=Aurantiacibacter gangjinensis TaxID=502682 RepID=UPI0007ECF4E3|nr:murein L,D-transpeptidase catalytic domain family protein [Aurantiacibacter gangjinensis]APE29294.1 hypothetical protein BMF35_b0039 [Aurantiacibacter gangjinensis]